MSGKRELAATIRGFDHSSSKSTYSNIGIEAHLRGWDAGLMIGMRLDEYGEPVFEFWTTGGSNDPGKKQRIGELEGLWRRIAG